MPDSQNKDKRGRVRWKLKLFDGAAPSLHLGNEENNRAVKPMDIKQQNVEEKDKVEYEFTEFDFMDFDNPEEVEVKEAPKKSRFVDPSGPPPEEWDPFPDAPVFDKVSYVTPANLVEEGVSTEELLRRKIKLLEEENAIQKAMLEGVQKLNQQQEKELDAVRKLFTPQQMNLLSGVETKPKNYSDKTIQNCALLRYASGATAYQVMRDIGYPLVHPSTISRRIDLKFKPGILDQNFKMLKVKARRKPEYYKEAVLVIDEMNIQPKIEYDPSTKELSGLASVPKSANSNSKGLDDNDKFADVAQHGLVYYLCGVKERWKTVVGYDFTVGSFDAKTVADRIRYMVEKASCVGVEVLELISDMGGCNQAT